MEFQTIFSRVVAMTLSFMTFGRAVRPFSGGERMMREQRGPIGSESESQNPLVWAFVIVVEEVGVTTLIEVGVGIIAAIATITVPKKPTPKDECLDKYEACMDSALGNLVVDVHGKSLCETCRERCQKDEAWPSKVRGTKQWHPCQ